jgi:hypothetical protein
MHVFSFLEEHQIRMSEWMPDAGKVSAGFKYLFF